MPRSLPRLLIVLLIAYIVMLALWDVAHGVLGGCTNCQTDDARTLRAVFIRDAKGSAIVYPAGYPVAIDGKPYTIASADACPAKMGMTGTCIVIHDGEQNVPVSVTGPGGTQAQHWSYAVMNVNGASRVVYRTSSGSVAVPQF